MPEPSLSPISIEVVLESSQYDPVARIMSAFLVRILRDLMPKTSIDSVDCGKSPHIARREALRWAQGIGKKTNPFHINSVSSHLNISIERIKNLCNQAERGELGSLYIKDYA
jgi:hypothetical protein